VCLAQTARQVIAYRWPGEGRCCRHRRCCPNSTPGNRISMARDVQGCETQVTRHIPPTYIPISPALHGKFPSALPAHPPTIQLFPDSSSRPWPPGLTHAQICARHMLPGNAWHYRALLLPIADTLRWGIRSRCGLSPLVDRTVTAYRNPALPLPLQPCNVIIPPPPPRETAPGSSAASCGSQSAAAPSPAGRCGASPHGSPPCPAYPSPCHRVLPDR